MDKTQVNIRASMKVRLLTNHENYINDDLVEFEDTYYIDLEDWEYYKEYTISRIKKDMMLIMGGGYKTDTIDLINFTTERV